MPYPPEEMALARLIIDIAVFSNYADDASLKVYEDVVMRVDRTELRTKRVPATKKPNSSNGKRSKRRIADFKSDRWYLAAAQSVSIRQNSSGSS